MGRNARLTKLAATVDGLDARVGLEDDASRVTESFVPVQSHAQEIAAIVACVPADCRESAAWAVPLLVATARSGGITHPRRIAYLLATAEQGSGFGARMVQTSAVDAQLAEDQRFCGRGFVYVSGRAQYAAWSQRLGLPDCIVDDTRLPNLVADPDAMARPSIAARTLVRGMRDGLFTGAALGYYVNAKKTDYYNARRVIDGTSHAREVAASAVLYQTAIERIAADRHREFLAEVTGRRAVSATRDILNDVREAVERLALRGEMLARPLEVLKWTGEARQGKFVQLDEQTCALHMGRGVYVELDIARDLHGVVPPEGQNMALKRSGIIRPTLGSGRSDYPSHRIVYDP